ncbi:MAG: hypothetical protein J6E41_09390 [Lachnospiraceae bacterium]|nr:hypothetical protein [Lachnospiraceae bacterium]
MRKVAEYFRSTITPADPGGSIRDTALKFNINRNKVRKILVTTGDLTSPLTEEALSLRSQGLSIKEIAKELGVSTATVSTALPYEEKVDNTLEPTRHAADVRDYRAYEKAQKNRQADLRKAGQDSRVRLSPKPEKEWQKDIRMSYTEAYHRPHRDTWEDVESMLEALKALVDRDDRSQELKDLGQQLREAELEEKRRQEEAEADRRELDALASRKSLTEEERNRQALLRFRNGLFQGALNSRNREVLEKISGDRLPPAPEEVFRLHMELYADHTYDDTTQALRQYGALQYGNNISRDIVVPADIPLYALHYAIQRAFGWQNSHLRQFELPEDRFRAVTDGNAATWSRLVGILFRSPLMEEGDEFWADDYEGGSFRNWLRRKYTGPYMSQCRGEGILSCLEDMKKLDLQEEYYLLYERAYNHRSEIYDGKEYLSQVSPVYDFKGNRRPEPRSWHRDREEIHARVEIVRMENLPSEALRFIFERNPMALLERLPLNAVLAPGIMTLPDAPEGLTDQEREYLDSGILQSGRDLYRSLEKRVRRIAEDRIDSPQLQPLPTPVTDVLLYNYDFGDNWKIRITASENCPDLVASGRITQAALDRANVKCREVYRPVLIARDGEMLVEDVGGLHGFADFLRTINPDLGGMDPDEKEDARRERKEYLTWARSLGWHRGRSTDFNLL